MSQAKTKHPKKNLSNKAIASLTAYWRNVDAQPKRRCLLCGKPVASTQTFCVKNCAARLPMPTFKLGLMPAHSMQAA